MVRQRRRVLCFDPREAGSITLRVRAGAGERARDVRTGRDRGPRDRTTNRAGRPASEEPEPSTTDHASGRAEELADA